MFCRRRNNSRLSHSYKRHRSQNHSCWRNPFLVFFLTFCTIGSVRFRKREDRTKAASFLRHPQLPHNNKNSVLHPEERSSLPRTPPPNSNQQQKKQLPTRSSLKSAAAASERQLPQSQQQRQNKNNIADGIANSNTSRNIPMTPSGTASVGASGSSAKDNVWHYKIAEEGTNPTTGTSFIKYALVVDDSGGIGATRAITIGEWATTLLKAAESPSASDKDSQLASSSFPLIELFVTKLADAPYEAFFFETPATSTANYQHQPFEFVLVDAPDLLGFADGHPNAQAFREYFDSGSGAGGRGCSDSACAFPSLGGDATLIAPKPINTKEINQYGHLAAFLRNADKQHVIATAKMAIGRYLQRLEGDGVPNQKQPGNEGVRDLTPVWFSTSGMGIAWLHFRIDSRPKYYTYNPYKTYRPIDVSAKGMPSSNKKSKATHSQLEQLDTDNDKPLSAAAAAISAASRAAVPSAAAQAVAERFSAIATGGEAKRQQQQLPRPTEASSSARKAVGNEPR